jgi:hypothetical protein
MKRSRLKRGLSLVEVVTAAVISTLVIVGAMTIFLAGMRDWTRGAQRMDAEIQSRQAMRTISSTLRGAMVVTVDADGQGLDFRMPKIDAATGLYVSPVVWDNVTRKIKYISGKIVLQETGNPDRTLATNVITTDPKNANAAYRIFVPGPGAITRQLTAKVVCVATNAQGQQSLGRKRETIFLRNIPQLTK